MNFRTFAAAVLTGTMGVFAVETNTYYTVTVDGGTYSSPVSLETLDVTVEKEGEEAVIKPFAEVWEEFAGGPAIFRKRGAGWMMCPPRRWRRSRARSASRLVRSW